MSTTDKIKLKLKELITNHNDLIKLSKDHSDLIEFGSKYQPWYSDALKILDTLGQDRLEEFKSYYLVDTKRKNFTSATYVVQDYLMGRGARTDVYDQPLWDIQEVLQIKLVTQLQILQSLHNRIDSVLQNVTAAIFSDIQDKELEIASKLIKINLRASGALAGVILEQHLQVVAQNHNLSIKKKNPTISDLNDPLKSASIYDVPVWRKIQYLADIRNICSHKKDLEPSKEQVEELISGVNYIIKSVF